MDIKKALRFGISAALLTVMTSTLPLGAIATDSVSAAIGDWEGRIDTGDGSLRVVVHLSQAADGALNGTLDSPDQGAAGTAIDSVTYKEPDLHFAIQDFGSTFDGQMNHDHSEIAGVWKQSGRSLPLVFKRRSRSIGSFAPGGCGNIMDRMIARLFPLLTVALVCGQDNPARLTFEVASVKPSKTGDPGGAMKVMPGGLQFVAQNFPLRQMIARMNLVPPRQITGGPDWMESERWDIQAKADRPGYTREQMMEMLGHLIEDEFKLKLRKYDKEGPVYALTIDKSGLKMKVNQSPEDYEIPVQGGPNGVTVGKRVAMDRLCFQLGSFLQNDERPVIDKTGLTGYYDFTLSFMPQLPPGFDLERLPPELQARPSLFDAVRSQLGLKLEATKGPVQYYVVEHIEKPSSR